ncbi:hypothetical protein MMC20_000881 [Loxospora ochrophaea]|nr:hypothetical protein [Loxospora ochrophaea]
MTHEEHLITAELVESSGKKWPEKTDRLFRHFMLEHDFYVYRKVDRGSVKKMDDFLRFIDPYIDRAGWSEARHQALFEKKVLRRIERIRQDMLRDQTLFRQGKWFVKASDVALADQRKDDALKILMSLPANQRKDEALKIVMSLPPQELGDCLEQLLVSMAPYSCEVRSLRPSQSESTA